MAWNPGYNSANNHYTLTGTIAYDSDGNLTNDTFHTYSWLPDGHVASIDTSTILYDALGNKVEENVGGAILEYVSGFGVDAQMSGQALSGAQVNLPGGVQALYAGTSLQRYRFPDWQGSIRAESNTSSRLFTYSVAFAPFGERYILKGAPLNVASFTGSPDQIVPDEYDFMAREEHNGQGRWISPDPMRGMGNKYVYADNNPLSKVDLYGLLSIEINGIDYGGPDAQFDGDKFNPYAESESHQPKTVQTAAQPRPDQPQGNSEPVQSAQNQAKSQAQQSQVDGQPAAQNQTNGAGQAHGAGQQGDVATANHYLSRSKEMRLVEKAFKSGHFHLEIIHDGNDRYDPATRTVYWDPHSALETTEGGHQTPALGLGHEMAHATGNRHDTAVLSNTPDAHYDTKEERRVILNYENPAARELGESTRSNHGGVPYNVDCPTCQ